MNPLAFALALQGSLAFAADTNSHSHPATLATHEHGVGQLNLALDQQRLDIELEVPAFNLLGFEHQPRQLEEKKRLSLVYQQLNQPLQLFAVKQEAQCSITQAQVLNDIESDEHEHEHEHETHWNIRANYQLNCQAFERLTQIDLSPFFKAFPNTQSLQVQMIGPNGQQGIKATLKDSLLVP